MYHCQYSSCVVHVVCFILIFASLRVSFFLRNTRANFGCSKIWILVVINFIKGFIWILDIVLTWFHNTSENDGLMGLDSTSTVFFCIFRLRKEDWNAGNMCIFHCMVCWTFLIIIGGDCFMFNCTIEVEIACYHVKFVFAEFTWNEFW